jgi:tRNA modification GTPase
MPIMTNSRHARALEAAQAALARAEQSAGEGLSEELLLEDLREAMRHLGEITGEYGTERLYDRIFSTFCIGK